MITAVACTVAVARDESGSNGVYGIHTQQGTSALLAVAEACLGAYGEASSNWPCSQRLARIADPQSVIRIQTLIIHVCQCQRPRALELFQCPFDPIIRQIAST